ncbi:COG1470 family protein [Pseudarthrobacter sp. alpha12b]
MHNQDGQPQRRKRRAIKAALVALLLLLATAGSLIAAANIPKPGITVQVSPASQSVQQGQSAAYTVTVTSTGGFGGTVNLVTAGLPAGASGAFTPSSVTLGSGASATATLNATTNASTPAGTSSLTITGTSGKVSGSTTAGLTVNYKISTSFSVSATPDSVTIPPGATAVYTLQLTRNNLSGPVSFSVMGGLPAGATASFSPSPATGNSTTLQVATTDGSPKGTSSLYLVATGKDSSGKAQYAYANVQLVLDPSIKQFALSGNVPGSLSPGTSAGLDLQISNPTGKPLSLTNLSAAIAGIARSADAVAKNLPCSAADFAVTQYSGPYPLTVPTGSSSLSGLGVAQQAWPRVGMLDSSANQDGCKGANLQLTYSGSGQGN